MLDLLMIALVCFFYAKAKRAIIVYQNREQEWRTADAEQRAKIVREECARRVLGRVVGAGTLIAGGFVTASPTLAVMWALVAWRMVKPIRAEVREACCYRSAGSNDEAPYSW